MPRWDQLKCTCDDEECAWESCETCIAYMNGVLNERSRCYKEWPHFFEKHGPIMVLKKEFTESEDS